MAQPSSVETAPDVLIEAYRKAWARILTEQRRLLLDPLAYRRRRRLQELQVAVEQALAGLDTKTRAWIESKLPEVQQLGLATGAVQATGLVTAAIPALHDLQAAKLAAERLYDDLLAATEGVRESTKALIREIARDQTFQSIAGGDTAQQAGRAMEDILARKGVYSVKYADGSVHGLDDYSEMTLRTSTGLAYNQAAIDGASAYGVEWFEVLDGPGCGWITHTSGGPALGKIVTAEEAGQHPLSHPRCVAAGTEVVPLGGVSAAYRSFYSGPMIEILSARGSRLTVTPNHPVLTDRGWLAADLLREGDQVLNSAGHRPVTARPSDVNVNNVPAKIEQVFDALGAIGARARFVATPDDFHNDGQWIKSKIDVVYVERPLLGVGQPGPIQSFGHADFVAAVGELDALAGLRSADLSLERLPVFAGSASCSPAGLHIRSIGRAGADLDPALFEPLTDDEVANADLCGEILRRFSVEVSLDTILEIRYLDSWLGHVYDLTCAASCYTSNGIVVHNCRRSFAARPDVTSAAEAKTAKRLTTPEQAAAQLAQDEERAQTLLSRQNRRQAAARASRLPAGDRHAARLQSRSARLAGRRVRTGI